ncbi:hypothetical protein T484DRAFT_1771871 [Baffinella frigidus]|nr:hypothetical protein T484DRAFT_1771871 [Cryptophyta sp. CCMP2293]
MAPRYRAVVGAGLVVPLSIGRVELNYTKGVRTFRDAVVPLSIGRVELNYTKDVRTFRDAGDRTARWQVAVGLGE